MSGYEGVAAIDDPIFKTINHKICYPGQWSERTLHSRGLQNLNEIKWVFNARPDIMIITSTDCIIIETKIVSNEGKKSSTSYSQYQIQRFLGKVMKALIPQFSELEFHHVIIDVKQQPTIYWREIIEIIRTSDIDSYTKSTFELLDYRINQRLIF